MDIIERIWEEQELDLLLFQEEMNEMKHDKWVEAQQQSSDLLAWAKQTSRDFAQRTVAECELMEEGMPVLISVEELIHTDEQPYCPDESCPCHDDVQLYGEYVLTPFMDGLQTFEEANALHWGENI